MDVTLKTLGSPSEAADVREYVMTIHLLAIKHQKQLVFDFTL
jgi:hypothetical protein